MPRGQAGVRRFVMVSYFGAGPDHGVSQDNSFFPVCRGEKRLPMPTFVASDLDWNRARAWAASRWNRRPAGSPWARPVPKAPKRAEFRAKDVALVAARPPLSDDSTHPPDYRLQQWANLSIAEALARHLTRTQAR